MTPDPFIYLNVIPDPHSKINYFYLLLILYFILNLTPVPVPDFIPDLYLFPLSHVLPVPLLYS